MTRKLVLIGILLAALFAACGQDEPTLTAAQAEAQLTDELGLTPTETNLGEFSTVIGTCTVLLVATGEAADLYAEDEWTVTSPDGVLVKVVPTTGTPAEECLLKVETALAGGGA